MAQRLVLDSKELYPIIEGYLLRNIFCREIMIEKVEFADSSVSIDFSWSDSTETVSQNGNNHKERQSIACPVCGKESKLLRLHLKRTHPEISFTDEELADLTAEKA